MFEEMIKRCNEFLWTYQYPASLGDKRMKFGSPQHRDLVITFFAGIVEVLMYGELVIEMLVHMEQMSKVDWLPDARFKPLD